MGDSSSHIETLNELKIWLEGEFKLIRSTQDNNAEEIRTLRKTVHDTNNAVGGLVMLNIPGKLEDLKNEVQGHDSVIEKLANDHAALKTTMRAAYIAIGVSSALIGSLVTIALRIYEVIGV